MPSTVHTVTKINPRKILPCTDICKRKKEDFFLLFLSLRTIIIFYRQMQKLYMNAANHSGSHLFSTHLWYCTHHWCWLSRFKVNTVLSSNKVPVIRSVKLLYCLSWAQKISQLLWLSSKKNNYKWITISWLNTSTWCSMIRRLPFLIKLEFKLENRSSCRKTSKGKGKNQQQTQSHMASTPGFQPGQH